MLLETKESKELPPVVLARDDLHSNSARAAAHEHAATEALEVAPFEASLVYEQTALVLRLQLVISYGETSLNQVDLILTVELNDFVLQRLVLVFQSGRLVPLTCKQLLELFNAINENSILPE